MTTTTTNTALLNNEAKLKGYVGNPMTSAEALLWLSTNTAFTYTPATLPGEVNKLADDIKHMKQSGKVLGLYPTKAACIAANPVIADNSSAIFGTNIDNYKYWLYVNGTWVYGHKSTITVINNPMELPKGLGREDSGAIFLSTGAPSKTASGLVGGAAQQAQAAAAAAAVTGGIIYIWDGASYIVAHTPVVIDNFNLTIVL